MALQDGQMQRPALEMVEPVLQWMKQKGYGGEGVSYDAVTGAFTVG